MKTYAKVKELVEKGFGTNEISRTLGISSASVSYHKRNLSIETGIQYCQSQNDKIQWDEIQNSIDDGKTHLEICELHNVAKSTITAAYKRGQLVREKRPHECSVEEYLSRWMGRKINTKTIKRRLIDDLGWERKCAWCDLKEWRGQPAPIELDHIDGDPTNNCLENFRFLCLHCHTQTDTFGWRNEKVRRKLGR